MSQVQEAKRLLGLAIDADEKKHEDTVGLYISAAQYCLATAKTCSGDTSTRLKSFSKQAIERAEKLKDAANLLLPEVPGNVPSTQTIPNVAKSNPSPTLQSRPSQKFTKEEVEVIRLNSRINGKGLVYIVTYCFNLQVHKCGISRRSKYKFQRKRLFSILY